MEIMVIKIIEKPWRLLKVAGSSPFITARGFKCLIFFARVKPYKI